MTWATGAPQGLRLRAAQGGGLLERLEKSQQVAQASLTKASKRTGDSKLLPQPVNSWEMGCVQVAALCLGH